MGNFKSSRIRGRDGHVATGPVLCTVGGKLVFRGGRRRGIQLDWVKFWGWQGVRLQVKVRRESEEAHPDCKERRLEVRAKVRIRVRGWSPSCAEGWRGWRKRLIYWCRW